MDNLCHTLVGAALGEAGLKRRTRYGSVALMIAANLPDIDVLVFATDTLPVSFRRGWTHGIGAQLLLPIALTAAVAAIDRWRPRSKDPSHGPPVHMGWLLALACIGVSSHVLLDLLNNYGVRLLTPFSWRWFYGDAVFIIDPWLWLTLGVGTWLARRRAGTRPARVALLAASCYIGAMVISTFAARDLVLDAWRTSRGREPRGVMAGPSPVTPLTREVIVDAGDHYVVGVLTWWPARVTFRPEAVPKQEGLPEVAAARASSEEIRSFLTWSRFPFWELEPAGEGTRVTVRDMRFRVRGAFSASTIVASRDTSD
jgi:inner membrane protein